MYIHVVGHTQIMFFIGVYAGLTIGTEQSFYSVREDEGSLEVCIEVLLGTVPPNYTYIISYTTSQSTAEGNQCTILSETKIANKTLRYS